MPYNIGAKIGLDGYAEYMNSLKSVIQRSKELTSEMKLVTSAFDANDKSQEKLTAQMDVLSKQISNQEKKVELLNSKFKASQAEVDRLNKELQDAVAKHGETSEQAARAAAALERQARAASQAKTDSNNAAAALEKMGRELEELKTDAAKAASGIDDAADSMDDAAESAEDAAKSTSIFGDVLTAGGIIEGVEAFVGAVGDIVDSAAEYNRIMGTLETSSQQAGYTADETSETYRQLYRALGDEQSTATAVANLQAMGLEQEDLNRLVSLATGAWATYGDSIPIDSLAESINETVKSGQVTGTLADVLNWGSKEGETFGVMLKDNTEANKEWNDAVEDAETAEDYFNLALQECGSESERANKLMQALADQGLASASEAWYQNNEDIATANDTQLTFMENAGLLAERLAPVTNAVKDGFGQMFEAIVSGTEGIDFAAIGETISKVFGFIVDNGDLIISLLMGIAGGISALKLADFATDIMNVATKTTTLAQTFPLLSGAISVLTNPVFLVGAAVVGLVALIATKGDEIQAILQKVDDFLQNVFAMDFRQVFGPVIGDVLNAFVRNVKNIWDSVKRIFDGIIDFIRGVFTGDWERAWEGVKNIFGGIFDGLVAVAKAPLNGVIGLINGLIGAINWVIDKINAISFTNPFTGESVGFNFPTIGKLPYLAVGGVVRRGSAIVGEAGPELMTVMGDRTIVQPLPSKYAENGPKKNGGSAQTSINITVNAAPGMDVNELADAVARKIQTMTQRKAAVW